MVKGRIFKLIERDGSCKTTIIHKIHPGKKHKDTYRHKKKVVRSLNSDFQILCCDALPLSCGDFGQVI